MHITIAKVSEVFFDGEAEVLTVPSTGGELTILGEHMPLITTLKAGNIVVRQKGEQDKTFPITSGVLEVRPEGVTVIL